MYKSGVRIADIAAHLNCSHGAVKYNIRLLKVKRRERGWKPHGYGEQMSVTIREMFARRRALQLTYTANHAKIQEHTGGDGIVDARSTGTVLR